MWNKEWIQDYESVWGIIEKFKLSNAINGYELLPLIGDREIMEKNNFQNVGIKFREVIAMSHLSPTLIEKYFAVNLHSYNEDLINSAVHVFPDHQKLASLFYPALSYCSICLSEGYHSIFHQIRLYSHCAFHPSEKLKLTCPYCDEIFKEYSVGKKEDAFCCQYCQNPIINNMSLQKIKYHWKSRKVIKHKLVEDWLNISQETVNKYHFYFSSNSLNADELVSGMSNYYADFPKLFNLFFNLQKDEQNIGNYPSNLLQIKPNTLKYQETEVKYSWNYMYQKLFVQYLGEISDNKATVREMNLSLHFECYIQSKAILKAAERYILNKKIPHHKKCVKSFFKEQSGNNKCVYARAFVEWKSESYGYGLETWRIERPLGMTAPKFYNEDWLDSFQIFPKLNCSNEFESVLRYLTRNRCNYQFNVISYVINAFLFKILVNRFEQFVNIFDKDMNYYYHDILRRNTPLFILAVGKDERKEISILL
ncbi:hypothetical protein MKY29_09630 [Psychrobacillus sp. FSL K6-2365]|uniref:hypothetical protein n=1 Tax=Psychrobacillus sp. FSL K6-2365 TaxID=2921546 RepID=UPI0030F67722